MKITQREDFGLIFMSILAQHYNGGYISLTTIAAQTKLSPLFLKHIVSRLLKNKLIKSREGLRGGYKLMRPPKSISIAEILEAISGNMIVPYCSDSTCRVKEKKCFCIPFWGKINKKILSYLQNVHLSTLVKT